MACAMTLEFVLVAQGQLARAATTPDPLTDCAPMTDPQQRLACYDSVHRRTRPVAAPLTGATESAAPTPEASTVPKATAPAMPTSTSSATSISTSTAPRARATAATAATGRSGLVAAWELDSQSDGGTFRMVPHRANYLLPFRWADQPNRRPSSPTPDHSVSEDLPLDAAEAKFQFSFKFKAWKNLLGNNGDLWLAYTQQSHWQVYNDAVSSPFRETNYEPEIILALRTGTDAFGWRWQHVNFGLAHQSNGRPLPLSRSWNRVYAQFGLERDDFTLVLRPWLRLPEKGASDDNPDARDFFGFTDLRLAYARGGHVVSALGRYSFSGRRGALQLDWAFPITGALKGYVQATSGYGESLIDYNHRQATIGLGLLLLPWQ
jgi:phospholipase A1/A2